MTQQASSIAWNIQFQIRLEAEGGIGQKGEWKERHLVAWSAAKFQLLPISIFLDR